MPDLLDDPPPDWWDDSDYALRAFVEPPLTDELGYQLPASYVALMRRHIGGMPRSTDHPAPTPTTWAEDHVAITGIFGIGRRHELSLGGARSGRWWSDEWGYPPLGVYIAACPSGGHDTVALDYRACGAAGEPQVVHVDEKADYAITVLAADFAAFVRGLCTFLDPED